MFRKFAGPMRSHDCEPFCCRAGRAFAGVRERFSPRVHELEQVEAEGVGNADQNREVEAAWFVESPFVTADRGADRVLA